MGDIDRNIEIIIIIVINLNSNLYKEQSMTLRIVYKVALLNVHIKHCTNQPNTLLSQSSVSASLTPSSLREQSRVQFV